MFLNEAILDQLIVNQYRAIRYHMAFAIGLATLGVGVAIVASLWIGRFSTEAFKMMFQIGGVFVSALSALPVKEVLNRKERAGMFETIKARLQALGQEWTAADESDRKRLDELLWHVVEKTALG